MTHRLGYGVLLLSLVLTARIAAADPTLSQASPIAIGTVQVGATGSASFELDEPTAGSSDDVDLDISTCPNTFSIAPSNEVEITSATPAPITVTYTPTTRTATQTCLVTVTDDAAPHAQRLTFNVTANGAGPALQTSAPGNALSFPATRVANHAIATKLVTLTNSGDAGDDLTITAFTFATGTDFSVLTGPALPITLAPGASTSITLAFDPTASASRTDALHIASNAAGAPVTTISMAGVGTNAVISAGNVAFGTVLDAGGPVSQNISIANTGALPVGTLNVTQAVLADTSGWFALGGSCAGQTTCALALAVGTTPATLPVTCDPTPNTASGAQTATVTFTSDSDAGGQTVATLTCTAGRPNIVLGTPAPTLQFGPISVGQSSTISFSVHNSGTSTLTYAIAETGAAYVVTSGACTPCSIAAGAADTTISVKFTPTAIGDVTGALTLTTNDPDAGDGSIAITLDGQGAASQIAGAPSTLAFGNVDVGKSLPLVLTVSNTGNSNLDISGAVLSGASAFSVTDGSLGAQTLAPGTATTWTIKCQPTAQGAVSGAFTIASDSLANPSAAVTLTCTGQLGMLAVAPTPFDFGGVRQGDTKQQTFTITNGGNALVSGITATLADATLGYTIVTMPATSLAGGGTTSLVVQFAPTSAADGGADSIALAGKWGTNPQTPVAATLQLNGEDKAAGYDVSTTALQFGDVLWDKATTQTFTIQLTDTQPVAITSLGLVPTGGTTSGEITQVSLQKNGAPATLPIQLTTMTDVITVGISAAPADRLGALAATMTVSSDLTMNGTRQVAITATSVSPALALSPATATLDFAGIDIDGPPAVMPITLTNTGSGALAVGAITTTDPDKVFTFAPFATPSSIAPGATATIMVTYAPTLEAADAGTVVIPLSGIFGKADGSQTIAVTGHGTNRHISIPSLALTFDPTFIYPTPPPQQSVHVANTGEAPLHIHMEQLTGDSAFTLVDTAPVTIAGGGSNDFLVTFDPITVGIQPQAILNLYSDDTPKGQPDLVSVVTVDGTAIDRDVAFGPAAINLGTVGIGIPRRITDILPSGMQVTSMDPTNTFHIQSITADQTALALIGAPEGIDLLPSTIDTFDAAMTPTDPGPFTATVSLYLDDDPNPRANVIVMGTAVFVEAQGGGGCAAGGGAGSGSVLLAAMVVVAARRRRRRAAVIAVSAVAALASTSALAEPPAQTRDLDASVFHPTPSTTGQAFGVQSASVGESGDFALQALLSYADKPLELVSTAEDVAIANRTLIDLGAAYAFLGRFEVAAHMPLYSQSGDAQSTTVDGDSEKPASGTARGDLALAAKARVLGATGDAIQLGVAASLTLPTATGDQFAGVADPEGHVLGLATIVPGGLAHRLALHLNAGAVLRARETYANIDQKSGFAWGAGATYRVIDQLWLDGEMYGELVPSGVRTAAPTDGMPAPTAALDTVEWLVGVRYQVERRTSVGLAVGRGLDDGFGSPALRGVFSMTFVAGARALAPIHPPPPPKIDGDADGDGIRDSVDKCPNDPEDKDGFEDEDGCPDPDNDHDGIPDAVDKCPLGAEDKDGFQDEDGCPDLDNDRDGILDAKDKCPNEPEDKDGFQDADGCPDPDNDHDGILDAKDKCPNAPETINGVEDEDGCPDAGDGLVVVNSDRLDLLDAVHWNGTKIAKTSLNLLGQVAATMRAHDEIVRLRVTVYVQPSGNAAHDQDVTDKRAAAVRDWLVQWGIAAKRLEAKGFGGTKPLMPAGQKGAAQLNERLELIILERK